MSLLNINELFDSLRKYLEARIDLFKFETKESITEAVTTVVEVVLLMIASMLVLVFLSLGLAMLLNTLLDSQYWGFFIIAAVYIILLLVALNLRKSQYVKGRVMAAMFKEEARKAAEEASAMNTK